MRVTHDSRCHARPTTQTFARHVPSCHVPIPLSAIPATTKTALSRRGTGPAPELRPLGWA
eukprot:7384804-Prymnesium_polylepis.2